MDREEAVALRHIRRALRLLLGPRLQQASTSQPEEIAAAAQPAAAENSQPQAPASPGVKASAAR